MKNVWILNHYAQEPGGVGATRHYSLAQHLLSHGWRASIIAASVEMYTGRQRLAKHEKKRIDHYSDIPFLWIRTPPYKDNGMGRIINMLTYAVRVLIPSFTRDLNTPDIVIGSSFHPFAAAAGAVLAKHFRVPFIFEVRDLWPQTLIDFGKLTEGHLVTRTLRTLETWLYRRADRIITLLPQAGEYIESLGISAKKIIWIPNGVELANYPAPVPPPKSETFTLMYLGAHGQANGLDTLLNAMSELRTFPDLQHVRLRMVGDGPMKSTLMQLASERGLDSVEFEGPVPKQQIPSLAAEADAFVITVRSLPRLYNYGISMNKLFDYLAASRPVVISSAASNNPVDEGCAGITVPPDNPTALAEAIAQLATLPTDKLNAMGKAGRIHAETYYAFEVLAKPLAATLHELTANTNPSGDPMNRQSTT